MLVESPLRQIESATLSAALFSMHEGTYFVCAPHYTGDCTALDFWDTWCRFCSMWTVCTTVSAASVASAASAVATVSTVCLLSLPSLIFLPSLLSLLSLLSLPSPPCCVYTSIRRNVALLKPRFRLHTSATRIRIR